MTPEQSAAYINAMAAAGKVPAHAGQGRPHFWPHSRQSDSTPATAP